MTEPLPGPDGRVHGRYSTYTGGCRCAECLSAGREYARQYRKEIVGRVARGEVFVPHGTDHGYKMYRCRCVPCINAAARARKLRRGRP